MSVFTRVTEPELQDWLPRFSVGSLVALQPISEGIENTNYFLSTTLGEYVLTLYERIPAEELPFYLNFASHLAKAGVAVPGPVPDRSGALFSMLNGKPAAITPRLRGAPKLQPSAVNCATVGGELAKMHQASQTFRSRLSNRRGPSWLLATYRKVRTVVSPGQAAFIDAELKFQRESREIRLPSGAIHADLFRDNALFDGDTLSGFIDFGFAASDAFAYDLAITVNDWCIDAEGELAPEHTAAMLSAYSAVRPLNEAEQAAWPSLLRLGALRFWLSRLDDFHFPRAAELNVPKDPSHFERVLMARVHRPCFWPQFAFIAEARP